MQNNVFSADNNYFIRNCSHVVILTHEIVIFTQADPICIEYIYSGDTITTLILHSFYQARTSSICLDHVNL